MTTETADRSAVGNRGNFLVALLVAWLIGVGLISLALHRSAHELAIIHAVDNMAHLVPALLGEDGLQTLRQDGLVAADDAVAPPAYRFYLADAAGIEALGPAVADELAWLRRVELDDTRINERGGYFKAGDRVLAWADFAGPAPDSSVLVVHTVERDGGGVLLSVYLERVIVAVLFSLWLMIWVALSLNHLLKRVRDQQAEMAQMALHDALTGLPNRHVLQDRLPRMLANQQLTGSGFALALALIDLDGFKGVNDNYGHASGDELLRQVAKRLRGGLRAADVGARLGGDEFVLLLSDVDERSARTALDHVHGALTQPYALAERTVTIGASIGVAIYPTHGRDANTLLQYADQAMYAAKAHGGGIRVYRPDMARPDTAANGGAGAYVGRR